MHRDKYSEKSKILLVRKKADSSRVPTQPVASDLELEDSFLALGELEIASVLPLVCSPLESWGLAGIPLMGWILNHVQDSVKSLKLEATIRIVSAIANKYKKQVKITDAVPIEGMPALDLFIRFPEARISFAVLVRATGDGSLFYNETTENICLKRKRKGVTRYNRPDLINLLKDQEYWLRRNRRDLLGGSSKDARRPVYRTIIFAKPSQLREHPEHLYANIGNQKFLRIQNSKGSVYLLQEDQVLPFLKAHLAEISL